MRERNIQTKFLIKLRKWGMLCRLPKEPKKKILISHTVYPDERLSSLEAEQNVWLEHKKLYRKNCQFELKTMSCICGIDTVEDFYNSCNVDSISTDSITTKS